MTETEEEYDLVWDSSLDIKASPEEIKNYLGIEKYKPCIESIYLGLGIPISLLRPENTNDCKPIN